MAVLPGQLALAVFSPPLDEKGNSVRGIAVCESFSGNFGLHMLRVTRTTTTSVIRASYTCAKVRSKLNRDQGSDSILNVAGDRILILELTGELMFVSAEIVASTVMEQVDARDFIILDLTRVTSMDQSASALLAELSDELGNQHKTVIFTGTEHHYHFVRFIKLHFRTSGNLPVLDFYDVDHALEYAEDLLLGESHVPSRNVEDVPLERQPLCRNFADDELVLLRSLLQEENFQANEVICQEGEAADKLYFLSSGRVSASLQLGSKHRRRLSAYAAGWAFGESALFNNHTRTAVIHAETPVRVYSLNPGKLEDEGSPAAQRIRMKLISNLSEISLTWLERANREIRFLTA